MEEQYERNFDLESFKRAKINMIATSDETYRSNTWDNFGKSLMKIKDYSKEEIQRIVESGSLAEQQRLSRNYFYKDGYYKQIIIHYATLLKYVGLLIPNPATGKNLSKTYITKRYNGAMEYVENMALPTFLANCAQRALVDGSYFGAKTQIDNKHFNVIDLPCGYCCSRFKDEFGNDLVEFNVRYFDTITNLVSRKAALAIYPEIIVEAYKEWKKGKRGNGSWVILPPDIGICFPFFDGRPLFLSVIPKTIEYDEAVATERYRDAEETRKIIVQKIPHLQDGRLLFEPDEAEEFHAAAVGMLKCNKNVNVLTTYADVEAITSKTSAENANNIMDRMEQNIFSQAGVSGQVFAATASSALTTSLDNDLALMMYLANKFSRFVTSIINELYGNANISFKYTILPVSYYNTDKYVETSFKLVGSGYSILLPALAMGMSQRDFSNVKDLENDILELSKKMKPLQSSYTQTANGNNDNGGRPTKDDSAKTETTIVTEESRTDTEGD